MESSIKPKFGRVLIKREIVEQTKGGIILTKDTAKRHATCEGVIVGLGETAGWTETFNNDNERISVQTLKIGDKVIFGRHSGAWIDGTYTGDKANDDGSLFICQDADILAVIKED